MKQQVFVTVLGEQCYEGVAPEHTRLMTDGTMETLADGYRVCYEDPQGSDLAGTKTSLEIHADYAVLVRDGQIRSVMRFEVGQPHTSLYEMSVGSLTVEIHTTSFENKMNADGGTLSVAYSVAIEHQQAGRNKFLLRVKTKDRG